MVLLLLRTTFNIFIVCEYEMFFVQSANLLHRSSMVTMFTQQYPWQRLSTPRDVSIVTDLTHSVYKLVFFFIDARCACVVTRFVGMVTGLFWLP